VVQREPWSSKIKSTDRLFFIVVFMFLVLLLWSELLNGGEFVQCFAVLMGVFYGKRTIDNYTRRGSADPYQNRRDDGGAI